ncbi:hypothetical protein MRB53_028490 [Persea americana]|uniref:Uncharacterized protein n=1 Tax=Persea americana TaxID=3435 RepID=A0ACC2KFQ9_PERAE|nr:hypothetical protein MRB53_028490 [Persea americana]
MRPIDERDWYTVYSFPTGTYMMPSASLFLYFQDDVLVMDQLDARWETFCVYHGNFFEQSGCKCRCQERDGRIIHRKQRSSNEVH